TAVMGPNNAPATAASIAPMVKTPKNNNGTRTPINVAIWRLEAPARTNTPARVRVTNQYRPMAAATPQTMIINRYAGYIRSGSNRTGPDNAAGIFSITGAGPQIILTRSFA